jgi:hypothetical protein
MRRMGLAWVTVAAVRNHQQRLLEDRHSETWLVGIACGASGRGRGRGAGANWSDGEFVRDVALKNMAEIELSRMALTRAPGQ